MWGVYSPVVFLIFLISLIAQTDQNVRKKRQILPDQPRIITENGHLIFQSGTNHNITFRSGSGGGVFVDNLDLKNAVAQTKSNKKLITRLQTSIGTGSGNVTSRVTSLENTLRQFQGLPGRVTSLHLRLVSHNAQQETASRAINTRLARVEAQVGNGDDTSLANDLSTLTARVLALESSMETMRNDNAGADDDLTATNQRSQRRNTMRRMIRRLSGRIRTLQTAVTNLQRLLTTNECLSNPCQHGGTCVDMYNGFFCRCPPNWQGQLCDQDVNECATYAGTDMGCQNGATCLNRPGYFICQCPSDWHGIHCSERHDDCTGSSHAELCGHGTCVNEERVQAGQRKFRCICEDGWTTNGIGPACNVDVDECASGSHCSINPPVQCINVPGSFVCGSCPAGYTGNGYSCSDVNECTINNGGCSMSPRVQCTNTLGSRTCGPCPSGYQGDGVTCNYVGTCSVNNGGCHPLANCVNDAGGFGLNCVCPIGYVGSGVGPNGCVLQSQAGACSSSPCQNGATCVIINTPPRYRCFCRAGYSGTTCSVVSNACASNPCQNGGTCTASGTGYSCQCTEDYTGTNCERTQQACGGYLRGESGSFRYPRTEGTNYGHRVSCAWSITTSTDKVLSITFTSFNLEAHRECNFDFLQIHDGPTASAHMIGKYCGTALPNGGTINSTSNHMYFWFKSDASVSSDGFAVSWTSHPPVCGGNLVGDHGAISSPGYPGNYPHNRDCVWTVRVNPSSNILFTFAHLGLETHSNCSYDYLEIRDGENENSPLLQRFCHQQSPAPIQTTGPFAFIRFHSDESLTDRGFHITYAALNEGRQGCGGALNASSGTLTSPGFPSPYQTNTQCVWVITVAPGAQVSLTFLDFDLETSSSCQYDSLTLRDGIDQNAPLLGQFCGTDNPAPVTSSGNVMFIELRSDESMQGSGFRAQWTSDCGGTFVGTSGQIQSPNFPNFYPHNKVCVFRIQVPRGSRVLLSFSSFQLEDSIDCQYDYLEVRDGANADSPLIRSRMCDTGLPEDIRASGNVMYIKFVTDGSESNGGFQATYSTVDSSEIECGGVINSNLGEVNSPSHPSVYPHGVNCTWYINVEPGMIVRLIFHSFSFENPRSGQCLYDFLEVYDNSTMVEQSRLGRYCGSDLPEVMTSSSNNMVLFMQTDDTVTREGFHATFVALNVSTVCGSHLTATEGVITSPNYPNNYPHDRQCEWTITVPAGNQIRVNFTDFDIEYHRSCNYDFLEVRNGGYLSSPIVWKRCGQQLGMLPILSHSNRLYIRFVTDHSSTGRGFRLEYDGGASGCGADLTTSTGGIVSPNYPEPYHHNAECFWTITVSRGSTIKLAFIAFDVEISYSCRFDYLEVRENGPRGELKGKFCGNTVPNPIEASTNKLWLKYKTDASVAGSGFRAQYFSDCNNVLTGLRGVIESPNFPNAYPHHINCSWIINAPRGNLINVSFAAFMLEDHGQCRYDKFVVKNGVRSDSPVINTLCGNEIPGAFQSSSNVLRLEFSSDRSIAHEGFRLEWVVDGCGGYLTDSTGTFTSPNYPNPYPHRRECQWVITVGTGHSVELNITDFDLESHSRCAFDVLEVYAGSDDQGPRLTQLCHPRSQPQVLRSTGNVMFVRFKSDSSLAGKGFSATYTAIEGGCGGNFSTESGTIMSKNYPSNYDHNTECEWLITVEEGHTVVLTFTDFEVEGSDCSFDYVNMYDGADSNATLIASLCGLSLPDPVEYRSNSNKMFVRMRTDASVAHKGFSASYVTGCGGQLNAEEGGSIMSPNYPNPSMRGALCRWVISSTINSQRVSLTFTHINIHSYVSTGCENAYVAVEEGIDASFNDSDTIQNKYCGSSVPATITSSGSALTVLFNKGNYSRGNGFRAIYASEYSSCGGTFTAESGRFTSPGYPDSYPMNIECVWQINTSPGNNVQLSFSFFSLEPYGDISKDYIEIRSPDVQGELLGRWAGNSAPDNLTSTHGVWVKFRSDEDTAGQGFIAEWTSSYGGQLTSDHGQIASPLYPFPYPANANYRWTITVTQNMRIQIQFSAFELEGMSNVMPCSFDSVEIFDGTPETGTSLGKFCGRNMPDPVFSTTNEVTVVFITDVSVQFSGFLLTWDAVSSSDIITPSTPTASGCGGQLTASDTAQNLTSPGYPFGYADNLECVWTISVPEGKTVTANITSINLEQHSVCFYDYVKFFDGNPSSSRVIETYCGRRGNTDLIQSTTNILGVKFKTDYSVNGTGFALTYQQGCGGYLQSSTGVIESPGYPNNYPADQNCTWKVAILPGKTIRLNFATPFNIAGTDGCSNDYLALQNGFTAESPPLLVNGSSDTSGKYCGTSAPQNLETADHYLYANFISDGSTSGSGFSFTYTEVSFACGGHLRLSHSVTSGYISSPNYPENYPHNVDCMWIISGPATERIQVDFEGEFRIEGSGSRCLFDYVEFHDGGTINSPRIGNALCGSTLPGTVSSTGNFMLVRFRTDSSIPHAGFKAKYSIATCGGRLIGNRGVITSPNYPSNYDNNADCEWVILGPVGHFLTINFTNFQLQVTDDCNSDFLEIRDVNSTGESLFQGCSRPSVMSYSTSDNTAYIRFKTDSSGVAPGFRIVYQASVEECGGQLTTPNGVITSPNYPGQYAHRRHCTWDIKVQEGRKVTLTFTDLRLEAHGSCRWDYVQVFNGILRSSPILGRWCTPPIPDPMESSGNTMQVVFFTDGSVSNGGFRATYSSDQEADCGGYVTDSPGNITSPGFNYREGNYSHNLECIWHFHNRQASNSSIRMEFQMLRLEYDAGCHYDFVAVREGVDATGQLVDRFCGNNTPSVIIIPSTDVWVRFKSDHSIAHHGFMLVYEFTQCGGIVTDPEGVITSPNYPNDYDHKDACAWRLTAPEGQRIRVRFTDFSFENHTNCRYDYLQIQNGGRSDSPVIDKYCGVNKPPEFLSQSNKLLITMKTDVGLSARGFRMEYSFESGGCGGLFHSQTGNISTPNYPSSYPHNTECVWDINVNVGNIVVLNFNPPFDLEAASCVYDYVEAFDVMSNGTQLSLGKWCHNVNPPTLRSTSNRMVVKFRSDFSTNGNGFSATWSPECGGLFTEDGGTIYSPNYPSIYRNNLKCNYTISPGPGKHIGLTFQDFELEGGSGCNYDFVKVFKGNSSEGTYLGKFCGTEKPDTLTSEGEMYIQFWTDSSAVFRGFRAVYFSEECGGVLTESSKRIQSPLHPNPYQHNANCSWQITVDPNQIIAFKFMTFEIEPQSRCAYDYVAFYDGPDANSDLIGKYCGDMENIPSRFIKSMGNQMFINFVTDSSVSHDGFSGGYWATYGPAQGCGGTLRQSSGRITSLDIDNDGNYEHNLECEWLIYVDSNKVANFQILGMEIENAINCIWDSLKVYDGETRNSPLLGSYCGAIPPQGIMKASTNVILVVFRTDHSESGAGFNLTFSQSDALCGGAFNATDVSQTLSSPNYPNPATQTLRCTWFIESISQDRNVRVTINDIQMQSSQSCGENYLLVRDEPMGTNGKQFHYCGTSIPPPFTSLGQRVRIVYHAQNVASYRGFQLTYEEAGCSINYTRSSGQLTSPAYPSDYPRNLDCTIMLTAPQGTSLALYFNTFEMEYHRNCRFDYVEVLNSSSLSVGKYCSREIPSPIFLNDNIATLKIKTDSSVQHGGFDLTYVASSEGPGCGGNITHVTSGVFTSPNYPGNFSSVATCSWYIYPPPRLTMFLQFTYLNVVGDNSDCSNYVAIYTGISPTGQIRGRFCNSVVYFRRFRFTMPTLVQFVSSGSGSAPVFRLQITSQPVNGIPMLNYVNNNNVINN